MNSPLVSVGLPTYKRIDSLIIALDCVRNQTYSNLEIIISNDDKFDSKTDYYVRSLMEIDKRIVYYNQSKNLGVIKNQLFVLNVSSGKYFMWMSDDDLRSHDFVEKIIDILEHDHSIGFAFSDFQEVLTTREHNSFYIKSHYEKLTSLSSNLFILQALKYFWQPSKYGSRNLFYSIFRKSLLGDINFNCLTNNFSTLHMDSLITFHLLQRTKFSVVNEVMCMLTTGNEKFYNDKFSKSTFTKKIVKFTQDRLGEYLFYFQNSSYVLKFLILLVFIPKFCIDIFHLLHTKMKGNS